MTRDELRDWICQNYHVGTTSDSMGPDLLDRVLAWAGRYSNEEMREFLSFMLPEDDDLQELIQNAVY